MATKKPGSPKVGYPEEQLKSRSAFDASAPVHRDYETRLFDYYGSSE